MSRKSPEEDPTSIGNILVAMEVISADKLQELIVEFKETEDELLGQFLIKKTHITEEHIELALIKQKQLRGKITHAMLRKTIEISNRKQDRLISSVDNLTAVAQMAVAKVNGKG